MATKNNTFDIPTNTFSTSMTGFVNLQDLFSRNVNLFLHTLSQVLRLADKKNEAIWSQLMQQTNLPKLEDILSPQILIELKKRLDFIEKNFPNEYNSFLTKIEDIYGLDKSTNPYLEKLQLLTKEKYERTKEQQELEKKYKKDKKQKSIWDKIKSWFGFGKKNQTKNEYPINFKKLAELPPWGRKAILNNPTIPDDQKRKLLKFFKDHQYKSPSEKWIFTHLQTIAENFPNFSLGNLLQNPLNPIQIKISKSLKFWTSKIKNQSPENQSYINSISPIEKKLTTSDKQKEGSDNVKLTSHNYLTKKRFKKQKDEGKNKSLFSLITGLIGTTIRRYLRIVSQITKISKFSAAKLAGRAFGGAGKIRFISKIVNSYKGIAKFAQSILKGGIQGGLSGTILGGLVGGAPGAIIGGTLGTGIAAGENIYKLALNQDLTKIPRPVFSILKPFQNYGRLIAAYNFKGDIASLPRSGQAAIRLANTSKFAGLFSRINKIGSLLNSLKFGSYGGIIGAIAAISLGASAPVIAASALGGVVATTAGKYVFNSAVNSVLNHTTSKIGNVIIKMGKFPGIGSLLGFGGGSLEIANDFNYIRSRYNETNSLKESFSDYYQTRLQGYTLGIIPKSLLKILSGTLYTHGILQLTGWATSLRAASAAVPLPAKIVAFLPTVVYLASAAIFGFQVSTTVLLATGVAGVAGATVTALIATGSIANPFGAATALPGIAGSVVAGTAVAGIVSAVTVPIALWVDRIIGRAINSLTGIVTILSLYKLIKALDLIVNKTIKSFNDYFNIASAGLSLLFTLQMMHTLSTNNYIESPTEPGTKEESSVAYYSRNPQNQQIASNYSLPSIVIRCQESQDYLESPFNFEVSEILTLEDKNGKLYQNIIGTTPQQKILVQNLKMIAPSINKEENKGIKTNDPLGTCS